MLYEFVRLIWTALACATLLLFAGTAHTGERPAVEFVPLPALDAVAGDSALSYTSRYNVANAYQALEWNNIAQSMQFIEIALQASPDIPVLLQILACLQEKSGKWREAERSLEKLAALRPGDPDVLRWRGVAAAEAGMYKRAARLFDHAAAADASAENDGKVARARSRLESFRPGISVQAAKGGEIFPGKAALAEGDEEWWDLDYPYSDSPDREMDLGERQDKAGDQHPPIPERRPDLADGDAKVDPLQPNSRDVFVAGAEFSSHLPLLILDSPASGGAALLRMVDNESGENRPGDRPAVEAEVVLHPTDGSGSEDKRSYLAVFADGAERSIAGLPASVEWSILGTLRDKAMLRTWLGCTLGERMLPGGAPGVRYCELLLRDGENYRYQGLYLVAEKIVDGVWLSPRGVRDKTAVARFPLETVEQGQDAGEAYAPWGSKPRVLFPEGSVDKAAETAFSGVGAQMASPRPNVFFAGVRRLDRDSFIDGYLFNAVLMNRDPEPSYFFLEESGRVGMSPRFDFVDILDNALAPPEDGGETPRYFELLLQSTSFIDDVEARYYELIRNGILGVGNLNRLLDEVNEHLGAARARDWERWRGGYVDDPRYALPPATPGPDGETLLRQTLSFAQELRKMRRLAGGNDYAIRGELMRMHWREGLWTPSRDTGRNFANAALFIAGFFLTVGYARKRM